MKRHIIVQAVGITLLLLWTCVWEQPASDAGGPPVRLAVVRQVGATRDQVAQPDGSTTGLIPTNWESSTRLIPTELQAELIPVRASRSKPMPGRAADDQGMDQFLDDHLLLQLTTRSELSSDVLGGVPISRPLATVLPWTHSLTFMPRTKS